jgi:hypothetical protein
MHSGITICAHVYAPYSVVVGVVLMEQPTPLPKEKKGFPAALVSAN